jgi:sucrose-6-phosphate hydrolase SacC (GH32 family)
MAEDQWRMGFHIMPRSGIFNAPLAFNQTDSNYQLHCQSIPSNGAQDTEWIHMSSPNLVYWHYENNDDSQISPDNHDVCDRDLADMNAGEHGFDFSSPTDLVNNEGRHIALALMANPDAPYSTAPDGLTWANCLSVPRELTRDAQGALLQYPPVELEALRMRENQINPLAGSLFPDHRADILFSGITDTSDFQIDLDEACHISYSDNALSLSFSDLRVGAGRNVCKAHIAALHDLRLLIDSSSIEIFANKGKSVLTSRWFPRSKTFLVRCCIHCESAAAWTMDDVLYLTYE